MERPKKVNPSIIIYDVEREHKEDDLKEDLLEKIVETFLIPRSLTEERNKVHNFKLKNQKRVNWVVQLPAKYYLSIFVGDAPRGRWVYNKAQ